MGAIKNQAMYYLQSSAKDYVSDGVIQTPMLSQHESLGLAQCGRKCTIKYSFAILQKASLSGDSEWAAGGRMGKGGWRIGQPRGRPAWCGGLRQDLLLGPDPNLYSGPERCGHPQFSHLELCH